MKSTYIIARSNWKLNMYVLVDCRVDSEVECLLFSRPRVVTARGSLFARDSLSICASHKFAP